MRSGHLGFKAMLTAFMGLMLTVGQVVSVQAEISSDQYATVLNLSGKQRMLTQKMSKEALLVALEIDTDASASSLQQTVALFDKTLKGLRSGDAGLGLPATDEPRIVRQLGKIDELWAGVKPVFDTISQSKTASADQIGEIASQNLPLLKAMNKAVLMYEKAARSGSMAANEGLATSINLAGKQRMLTQKMSKEFLLIAYGHQAEDNKLNLLESYSLFDRTLTGLEAGDEVLGLPGTQDAAILSQLKVVKELWQPFKLLVKAAAESGEMDDADKDALADSNLPLLKEMNKAVKLFEQKG